MPSIKINTPRKSSSILTDRSIHAVFPFIEGKRAVIITDENLDRLYGGLFTDFQKIVLPPGESSKNLDLVRRIYEQMIAAEVDRSCLILGVGGGVVCDIAGFVASTYLRGLDFGFVATSLLAQVDASIGGKNGVNFADAKNLIGTINQPRFVLCPQDVLQTLPREHFINGMAEIIKTGAIGDAELLEVLTLKRAEILDLQPEALETVIGHTLTLKARIVESDEREQGERRLLNFGHTIGHAIEIATGMLHGQAVAIGMNLAAEISVRLGILAPAEKERLAQILHAYELPVTLQIPADKLLPFIFKDKKRLGNSLRFVTLSKLGAAQIVNLSFNQIKEFLDDLCSAG